MSGRLLAVLLTALTFVHGACDSADSPPCPGERVATFHFESVRVDEETTCTFGPAEVPFTATLSSDADSSAHLCLDRLEAEPLHGTRVGDHFDLAQRPAAASVATCACDLTVEESLEGDLVASEDGSTSFVGVLRDVVAPTGDGAGSCGPAEGADGSACGVPCAMVWLVTGRR